MLLKEQWVTIPKHTNWCVSNLWRFQCVHSPIPVSSAPAWDDITCWDNGACFETVWLTVGRLPHSSRAVPWGTNLGLLSSWSCTWHCTSVCHRESSQSQTENQRWKRIEPSVGLLPLLCSYLTQMITSFVGSPSVLSYFPRQCSDTTLPVKIRRERGKSLNKFIIKKPHIYSLTHKKKSQLQDWLCFEFRVGLSETLMVAHLWIALVIEWTEPSQIFSSLVNLGWT